MQKCIRVYVLSKIILMFTIIHQDFMSSHALKNMFHTFQIPNLSILLHTLSVSLLSVNLELINYLWIPNIFIYNLKTFQTIEVLSKLAGLWIDAQKRIYYSQATHITFICESCLLSGPVLIIHIIGPMVFDSFPLDTQTCKFQVMSQ